MRTGGSISVGIGEGGSMVRTGGSMSLSAGFFRFSFPFEIQYYISRNLYWKVGKVFYL